MQAAHTEFYVDGTTIPDVDFDVGPSWSGLLPVSSDPNETRKVRSRTLPVLVHASALTSLSLARSLHLAPRTTRTHPDLLWLSPLRIQRCISVCLALSAASKISSHKSHPRTALVLLLGSGSRPFGGKVTCSAK